jgi:hypothetical protein
MVSLLLTADEIGCEWLKLYAEQATLGLVKSRESGERRMGELAYEAVAAVCAVCCCEGVSAISIGLSNHAKNRSKVDFGQILSLNR